MIRLTTTAKWTDSDVYYLGKLVGKIEKITVEKGHGCFIYTSLDKSYKTGHWSSLHLRTHLRGYYDLLTIKQKVDT